MKTLKLVIETLGLMISELMASFFIIPIFVLLGFIAIVYGYCFVAEHEILSIRQKSSIENFEYTMTAT